MKRSTLAVLSVVALAAAATPAFGFITRSEAAAQFNNAASQEGLNARNSRWEQERNDTLNARNSRWEQERNDTLNARNTRSEQEHNDTLNARNTRSEQEHNDTLNA